MLDFVPSSYKLTAFFASLAVSFAAGAVGSWIINGWRNDSIELAAQLSAQKAIEASNERQDKIASGVESALANLKTTERIIDRGIIKEIRTNETVYRNVCITDDGRMLINAAAAGAVSSKPAAKMP